MTLPSVGICVSENRFLKLLSFLSRPTIWLCGNGGACETLNYFWQNPPMREWLSRCPLESVLARRFYRAFSFSRTPTTIVFAIRSWILCRRLFKNIVMIYIPIRTYTIMIPERRPGDESHHKGTGIISVRWVNSQGINLITVRMMALQKPILSPLRFVTCNLNSRFPRVALWDEHSPSAK